MEKETLAHGQVSFILIFSNYTILLLVISNPTSNIILNTYYFYYLCCVIILDVRGIPPIVVVINVMKTPVYAFVVILNTTGIVLSIACLIFNVIFQNRK